MERPMARDGRRAAALFAQRPRPQDEPGRARFGARRLARTRGALDWRCPAARTRTEPRPGVNCQGYLSARTRLGFAGRDEGVFRAV